VEAVVYDVLVAGQLSSSSGWKRHEVAHAAEGSDRPPMHWEEMLRHAVGQTKNRTVILSKGRYLGLAPSLSQPGDQVVVLFGLREPAILRPQQDGSYIFLGTAYIHGLMRGEALRGLSDGNFAVERVTIR
jgi:hypothetical protein